MNTLNIHDTAPEFNLTDQNGIPISLSQFRGGKVFVYFYPKASTSGCTTQATGLRDILPFLKEHKTSVIGISPDPPEKQKKFDDAHGLNFPLLSDPDHQTANAFGVWAEKSMYGKKYMGIVRSAFLIDENGKLMKCWYRITPKQTVPEIQKALSVR